MDEIFVKILSDGYGLRPYSMKRTRTCLVCYTNGGIIALKKQNADSLMIDFEAEGRNKLIENGFYKIDKFLKTTEDKNYYENMGDLYTAEKYRDMAECDMDNINTVLNITRTLANFHNAAYGLDFEGGRSALGKLTAVFNKRIAELKHIRKDILKRADYDMLDMIIKNNYSYFLNRAQCALDMLKESGYEKIVEKAAERKTFCHNGFKNGGFMEHKGQIVIESLPKIAYEIPVWDLAFLLRNMMKRSDVTSSYTKRIIEEYSRHTYFDSKDEEVVKAVLLFPWKFMSLCNEYYNKKRNYCLIPASERFVRCIEASMNEERILSEV